MAAAAVRTVVAAIRYHKSFSLTHSRYYSTRQHYNLTSRGSSTKFQTSPLRKSNTSCISQSLVHTHTTKSIPIHTTRCYSNSSRILSQNQESPSINQLKNSNMSSALETECVNTIRAISADQVQSANSGHPGAPMGCAPMAYLLWSEFMNYSAKSPEWIARDRFVLSNGHACALQYSMLHLAGYETSKIEDLKQFRQLGSTTPGHPENFVTQGE